MTMKKSKTSPGESYLERLKQNGLLTKENEEGHKEVAEMLTLPTPTSRRKPRWTKPKQGGRRSVRKTNYAARLVEYRF